MKSFSFPSERSFSSCASHVGKTTNTGRLSLSQRNAWTCGRRTVIWTTRTASVRCPCRTVRPRWYAVARWARRGGCRANLVRRSTQVSRVRNANIRLLQWLNNRPTGFIWIFFVFVFANPRGIPNTVRVATGPDHKPDDQPDGGDRRVHADAEHVQPRHVRQHARQFSLFVRQRLRVRRQFTPVHRWVLRSRFARSYQNAWFVDDVRVRNEKLKKKTNYPHVPSFSLCFSDDNECLRIPAPCRGISQCVNIPGSFECQCPEGYKLGLTARECVGKWHLTRTQSQRPAGDTTITSRFTLYSRFQKHKT